MTDYISEAEALSEIYDGFEENFEPYTTEEKMYFIRSKNFRFSKSDIGKFVIIQTPRRNKNVMKILYLVDRQKCKTFWWSHDSNFAMIFNCRSAAQNQVSKYRYNNAKIMEIKPWMIKSYGQ